MIISILNYDTGEIDIISVSPNIERDNENIEDYLRSLGYKLSEISYMVSDTIKINKIYIKA